MLAIAINRRKDIFGLIQLSIEYSLISVTAAGSPFEIKIKNILCMKKVFINN